jgi:hypothetical protein
MVLPVLALAYAGVTLYSIFGLQKTPLNILYAVHPICSCLFIMFASLGGASKLAANCAARAVAMSGVPVRTCLLDRSALAQPSPATNLQCGILPPAP